VVVLTLGTAEVEDRAVPLDEHLAGARLDHGPAEIAGVLFDHNLHRLESFFA